MYWWLIFMLTYTRALYVQHIFRAPSCILLTRTCIEKLASVCFGLMDSVHKCQIQSFVSHHSNVY